MVVQKLWKQQTMLMLQLIIDKSILRLGKCDWEWTRKRSWMLNIRCNFLECETFMKFNEEKRRNENWHKWTDWIEYPENGTIIMIACESWLLPFRLRKFLFVLWTIFFSLSFSVPVRNCACRKLRGKKELSRENGIKYEKKSNVFASFHVIPLSNSKINKFSAWWKIIFDCVWFWFSRGITFQRIDEFTI